MRVSEMHEKYTQLVEEEKRFMLKLKTCKLAEDAVFDLVYSHEPDPTIMEEILTVVQNIDLRINTEFSGYCWRKNALRDKLNCSRDPRRPPEIRGSGRRSKSLSEFMKHFHGSP